MEIWKYPLAIKGSQTIEVPEGAQFLSTIEQNSCPTLYFLVDPERQKTELNMVVVGTGHPIPNDVLDSLHYLGTIPTKEGFVWHAFVVMDDNSGFIHWPVSPLSHAMTRIK